MISTWNYRGTVDYRRIVLKLNTSFICKQYHRETVVELSISINACLCTWSISMISTWNYRGTVDIDSICRTLFSGLGNIDVELSISINSCLCTWSISMISTWNYRGTVDIDIICWTLFLGILNMTIRLTFCQTASCVLTVVA